ncbi:TPA: 3-phosphoshikimate 1-carboxyvinyltransferase [Candidatus Bathyarchaeota archaeon]|nr:3-phosphoshikimate 1-carboxyvinyltransferase [Candidatus Bathyarchaeota archaeon]
MKSLTIRKTEEIHGKIEAPPSKSYTHRAIIASSLSEGESLIENPLLCDDILATLSACKMLGAEIELLNREKMHVKGTFNIKTPEDVINCRNSASTIRFLAPICALSSGISVLTGEESLRKRPMKPLLDSLRDLGVKCYSTRYDGKPPIIIFGEGIRGGKTCIRGDVSSQFLSGLLFATPKAEKDTEIRVIGELESAPYVEMTINVLEKHGIDIIASENLTQFEIPSKQEFLPANHFIEGDYSSASFILGAAALTDSRIRVMNLPSKTLQGDKAIIDILRKMNVDVKMGENHVEVNGVKGHLRGININLKNNPDLFPICAVLAASAKGKTKIKGVKRLRLKESDRLDSMSKGLKKMGAKITMDREIVRIIGGELHGAEIDPHDDHRVAMAFTIAALKAEGETVIHNIECINKSYPNFVRDLRLLGVDLTEQ